MTTDPTPVGATLPETCVVLTGPTAVGKSAVALALAELLGGEILSVDSMQVYRGMDVGTAKPEAAERQRIPHHLLDVAGVEEGFDAARFVSLARRCVGEVVARGRRPILCGGTGLYLRALRDGLGTAPGRDPALRTTLEQQPLAALLDELRRNDPATYDRIDRRNPRRVVRAVEILRLTGEPVSATRAVWGEQDPGVVWPGWFALERDPGDLRSRIDVRVERMFASGLVEEVRRLMDGGLEQNPTARQALGYRQVLEHLEGQRDLPATVEEVKRRTWQFARRQMTWARHQLRPLWLHLGPQEPATETAGRLRTELRRQGLETRGMAA